MIMTIIEMRIPPWLAQGDLAAIKQWQQTSSLSVKDEFDRIIKILALQALTWQAKSKLDQALITLQDTVTLAESEVYIRTFVDEGTPMAALLTRLNISNESGTPGSIPAYIHKLLVACGENGDGKMAHVSANKDEQLPRPALPTPVQEFNLHSLIEPLTERELEVLQFLVTGLSAQEIADRLVIARSTLKTHLKRIYDKLEVHSRLQAIVKARELNLFHQV